MQKSIREISFFSGFFEKLKFRLQKIVFSRRFLQNWSEHFRCFVQCFLFPSFVNVFHVFLYLFMCFNMFCVFPVFDLHICQYYVHRWAQARHRPRLVLGLCRSLGLSLGVRTGLGLDIDLGLRKPGPKPKPRPRPKPTPTPKPQPKLRPKHKPRLEPGPKRSARRKPHPRPRLKLGPTL